MKRYFIITILSFVSLFSSRAGVVVTDSLKSNILGEQVKYNVYLPNGYNESDCRYPVVYLLHGLSDDYMSWRVKGNMHLVADEVISCGEACPMIIVMPNAGGPDIVNIQNGYFNVKGWSYEDFFFKELMPEVENKYRGISDKEHRAIMGLSMGGGGSTVYCQRHPEMFSSCYAMSAWLDNQNDQVGANDDDKNCYTRVCASVRDNSALKFVKNADAATIEQLNTVKWFVSCGDDDFLLADNFQHYLNMRLAGVNCEFRVRNGIHNWEYWHVCLREALSFATRNFGK